jgi:phosphonate transport system substrate-binding protein
MLREKALQRDAEKWSIRKFGLSESPKPQTLGDAFRDGNRDLVADTPEKAACIQPETLTFSYVVSDGPEGNADSWKPLMDRISETTGLPVAFHKSTSVAEQLSAIQSGELHVTALNTGSVPEAVNTCGFVPVSALASTEQDVGLRSLIIVPADSPIKNVKDIRGHSVLFTSPNSNSGFRAPLLILAEEFNMNPDIDYKYGFAYSHDAAILQVAAGEAEVATVASDLLERAVANGSIANDDYRVIHESERFPPAAIGYTHKLSPELAAKVREAIGDFEIPAEGVLASVFAHMPNARLVPVSYKDDWALIRRIDNSIGASVAKKPTNVERK